MEEGTSHLGFSWDCRKRTERNCDLICATAFSGSPYTLFKPVFDIRWNRKSEARKQEYMRSRGLTVVKIIVDGMELEFLQTFYPEMFTEFQAEVLKGKYSINEPLGQRLNGYGARVTYNGNS